MKRTILVGIASAALLGAGIGTAAADGIPLTTPVDLPVTSGSASELGNAIGTGSVDLTALGAGLGSAFGGGYANGVLSTLSAGISSH
ncbi:hypothetical protein [Nocardia sp. NPDC005825]|uniref:hypothetical protein n=1 Tax=unclassified Nocardia TaxID=2637762 RepID=UPI0033C47721